MSEFSAGVAVGLYRLDISDVEKKAQQLRQLFNGIRNDAAQATAIGPRPTTPAGSSPAAQAADQARIASAIERRANIEARLAQVQNTGKSALVGLAQAEQVYDSALGKLTKDSDAYLRVQTQLQTVQNRIANNGNPPTLPRSLENFGPEAIDQVKSGLLGVIGPAALVTGTFGALKGTFDSFRESLNFKAELDQTTASIATQLSGVRDSGRTFDEARAFGDRYKLTQQETAQAIQASIPILRSSKASLTDIESTLLRLQAKKPEKSIADAARALDELKSGQINSIVTQFNIGRDAANKMKDEIEKGGDAVTILSKYLDDAGVSADVLATRTQGVAGALNDVKIAREQLTIAEGEAAASKGGLLFLDIETRTYRGLANLLNGDVLAGLKATGIEYVAQQKASEAFNAAKQAGKTDTEAATEAERIYNLVQQIGRQQQGLTTLPIDENTKVRQRNTDAVRQSTFALSDEANTKLDSQIASAKLADEQSRLDADSRKAALGLLGAGDQALVLGAKYNRAASDAQFLINQQQKLFNGQAFADQRAGERSGGTVRSQSELDAQTAARRLAADHARQLQDAQDQAALRNARTSAQKIVILQRELARATDDIQRVNIQAQIDAEKAGGNTRVSAAQSTALRLDQVEQNSGLQLLKTQRENNERLADQQADFDLHRSRNEQDEADKIRRLLTSGQRGAADRERADFARQQQRDAEDFRIQRQRTLRNNAESTGDITARTDLQQSQIGQRAALKGVRPAGGVGGIPAPPLPIPNAPAAAGGGEKRVVIQVTAVVNLDGQKVGELIYPAIERQIDENLSFELAQLPPVGGGQSAVAGGRP